jgi:methionyl-tRNA formyltransferase
MDTKIAFIGSTRSSKAALDGLCYRNVNTTVLWEKQNIAISDWVMPNQIYLDFEKVDVLTEYLKELKPDFIFAIGISQIIPKSILDIAPCIGFHPTMLPEGRGRAPIANTILNNGTPAISLFWMDEEVDHGDLIYQQRVSLLENDTSETLLQRICEHLYETVKNFIAPNIEILNNLTRMPQDHSKATYYPKRTPEDGEINLKDDPEYIERLIRAAGRPYPGAYIKLGLSLIGDRKLVIWEAELL